MSIRVRTGYSFRQAAGKIPNVIARLKEVGATHAPITDTASTFGWVKWRKAAEKAGLKPVYGVELAVTASINEKKPSVDYWTFIAKDSVVPLNELVSLATQQFRYQPLLTREQASSRSDVWAIMGQRTDYSSVPAGDHLFVALGPSTPRAQLRRALAAGHQLIAASDNRYPTEGQQGFYETVCGRNASTQSYPQWILGDDEWTADALKRFGAEHSDAIGASLANKNAVLASSVAELTVAEMVHPPRPASLEEMCRAGAVELGCDLSRPEYAARLKRELDLIIDKGYEDYFYLVADICQWARQRMIVGPARGSSCGSLVCYLLKITTVDPIPYDLLFERFIDINRNDMPDIDIDFPEDRRAEVFDYVSRTYGPEKVVRLGTVAMYQPRSALKEAAGAMDIAPWLLNPVMDAIIERSSGDNRAMQATEDTLRGTAAGKEFLEKYPEILVAAEMEGHPRHAGQHAAGIVITHNPTLEYVAVDRRTGAAMCDKHDAEELGLLKIDALGLTQLSIFEHALSLAGLDKDHLFSVPLDDKKAFDVLNKGQYAGVFQFNGLALQHITDQIKVDSLKDIVAITALARPGPLNTGGTHSWIKARTGKEEVKYAHHVLEPYLKENHGIVIYQEDVMRIGREVGALSWEDVTALRKAMSRSLGEEFFGQYREKFVEGAVKNGMPAEIAGPFFNDLSAFGAWAFNKCLSGDTEVEVARTGGSIRKRMKISELYEMYEASPSPWIRQRKSKPHLISFFEGEGKQQVAARIHKNGPKPCYRFNFSDGTHVECTKDHKFIINGEWKTAEESVAGDLWAELVPFQREAPEGPGSGHAVGKSWNITDGDRTGSANPAYINGKTPAKKEFRKASKGAPCEDCGKLEKRMEVHHNDLQGGNERPDDLAWLCASCHKKRHYVEGRTKKGELPQQVSMKVLVGIQYAGVKETYDIEMPTHHNFKLANGLITHNSHAVAYGLMSYYCCWLKAHYPLEFAAATLSYVDTPEQQIKMLREMANEGVSYVPVDEDLSTDRWTVRRDSDGKGHLVGPLTNVKGIGPKMMETIMAARHRKEPLPERARKLLSDPKTKVDSLFPVEDAFRRLIPDPKAQNIFTTPTLIKDVQTTGTEYEVVAFCVVEQIKPKDENEDVNVAKRGGRRLTGPTAALNLRLADDTDVVFAKVNRWDYERIGQQIVDRGRAGKALYIVKGNVPRDFRMISVKQIRYVGDLDHD